MVPGPPEYHRGFFLTLVFQYAQRLFFYLKKKIIIKQKTKKNKSLYKNIKYFLKLINFKFFLNYIKFAHMNSTMGQAMFRLCANYETNVYLQFTPKIIHENYIFF